ncbi:MAG: hypothetical protein ACYDBJ_06080 [Aggregatilineales bacterium]
MTVTLTDTAIVPQANAVIAKGTAGVAPINAGQVVYADPTAGGQIKVAQATTPNAANNVVGIAVDDAKAVGQPISYQTAGDLAVDSSALTTTTPYLLSGATAGSLETAVASTQYGTLIGIATAPGILRLAIMASGAQHA